MGFSGQFKRLQISRLYDFLIIHEQVKGHLRMVANDGLLSYPIECGHVMSALS